MKVQFLSLCIRAGALIAALSSQSFAESRQIQGERVTQYREKIISTQEIMNQEAASQETVNNSPNLPLDQSMPRITLQQVAQRLGIERKNSSTASVKTTRGKKFNLVGNGPFSPPGTNNSTTSKLGIDFTSSTFSNVPAPNIYVHDTMGALGPEQYISTLNAGIRSFCIDREKAVAFPDGVLDTVLANFMNISEETSGADNAIISDPIIRFDTFSKRWYIMCIAFTLRAFSEDSIPSNNFICVAVSDSSVITPCTKWRILQIPHNQVPGPDGQGGDDGGFFDFPSLAVDKHAVYIGANIFNVLPAGIDMTAYVIQKKSLLDETKPLVITAFRHLFDLNTISGPFAPAGIDNFDKNPKFGYFIGVDIASFGLFQLVRIINPGSKNPTISQTIPITVPNTASPPDVSYKGNFAGFFANLNTLDDRLHQGHVRNGKLFTNHVAAIGVDKDGVSNANSALNDRAAGRWYEFSLKGNDAVEGPNSVPTLVQVGTVWDPTDTPDPLNFIFGSIMTSKNGDLTFSATETSQLVTPNAVTFRRAAFDPLGTIGPKQFLTTSEELYNNGVFAGQLVRWGDYSNTVFDPKDTNDQWTIQQFVFGYGNFGMHVRQLLPNN